MLITIETALSCAKSVFKEDQFLFIVGEEAVFYVELEYDDEFREYSYKGEVKKVGTKEV